MKGNSCSEKKSRLFLFLLLFVCFKNNKLSLTTVNVASLIWAFLDFCGTRSRKEPKKEMREMKAKLVLGLSFA